MSARPEPIDAQPSAFRATLRRGACARGAGVRTRARLRLAALAAAIAVPAMAAAPGSMVGPSAQPRSIAAMPFERAGENFPGSAFFYVEQDSAGEPGAGVMPEPPATDATTRMDDDRLLIRPASFVGPAARGFSAMGSGIDHARALQCLGMAVYYEAASESDAGQRGVAQVVLNRVAHPSYPNSVCGVVFQGSQRRTGCQFSFTCDGSMARTPGARSFARARSVARAALAGAVAPQVGLATHYHTIWINPYWASSLDRVTTIGAHHFYRWRGSAGRPAAFRMAYRGGEPIAGPLPRQAREHDTPPAVDTDPVRLARAFEAARREAETAGARPVATPTYTAEVEANGGDALFRADRLPSGGDIRAEYRRSGRWIGTPARQ